MHRYLINSITTHIETLCITMQGQQNRSGCSGFGRTSFSIKVKTKFHFYKKQVINKSASVIVGLVRLIISNQKHPRCKKGAAKN